MTEQQTRPLDTPILPDGSPTHRCTVCGAFWQGWQDGSWSLCSKQAGSCCDNAPDFADKIVPLIVSDRLTAAITRAVSAAIKEVGLSGVRNMSMFPSAEKKKGTD